MKLSTALFTIIVVCNCFYSINSANIQVGDVITEKLPSGKPVIGDIQPAPPVTDPVPPTSTENTTTPYPITTPATSTTSSTTPTTSTTTTAPTPSPNNTTTSSTTPPTPNTTTLSPNSTTEKPTTTPSPNNTTTTEKPTPTTPLPHNVTTIEPPTTAVPYITSTPAPHRNRFDGPSFIGGIVLSLGLVAIGFVGWKYYKARTERNYRTL